MDLPNRRIVFCANPQFAVSKPEGKPATLSGYALVWNVLSEDRGQFKVRLMPGSARFANPTMAYFVHGDPYILGNSSNGSLRYSVDEVGVKVEIDLPDTTVGRDVFELVSKRYVNGMSFAMVGKPDGRQVRENGQNIFEATNYLVDEVTVTPVPAFSQAMVDVKSPTDFSNRIAQANQLEQLKFEQIQWPLRVA